MESSFTLTIDWLAFTVLATNPQETMKVLGGDWSKAKGGFRGYPLSWMRTDGLRGVGKLGTNAPRRPNEIHVDLSGGLASALTLDQIRTLLQWVHKQQGHVTRIDCALDDRAGSVPVSTIREAVAAGQCVTRAAQVRHIVSNLTHGTGATTGETMYFGSPQSQTLLRIYDKRLELQSKGQENYQDYGTRWELELKKHRAEQCSRALATLDEGDWKELVVGLLRSYVDFRQIPKDAEDEERYRAPVLEWYALLTEGFQKGRLAQEKQVQTLHKLGGKTDTAICSSNHPIGFTGLPAVTRAAHGRGTGGVVRLPRCICTCSLSKSFRRGSTSKNPHSTSGPHRTKFLAVAYMDWSALNLRPSRRG
ncbi:MAG: hypothetical protein DYH03_09965 [Nitrospira sp. NTP1]|nr:hypothetical protein [Nitrospira sp. NTP1]